MKPAGKNRARMTEGPIGGTILSLMVPMMLGIVAILLNNLAGSFFIARVSTDQLAAMAFTFPIAFIVAAIAIALATGTSSVISRLFGSGNLDEVRRITGHAMLLAIVSALGIMVVGLMTIDPLFRLLGADEHTLPLIHRYMRIYYFGGIFMVAPMIANSVLRASGDAKRPALIMTTSAVCNIIIDPILIFGLFGFPRMEIEGAALGGVISNAITLCASAYFVIHREHLVSFRHFRFDLIADSWRRILKVGLPALTSGLMAPITTAFITSQVATFGHDAVAGFGMAGRFEGLSLLAVMSLSGAMTPFIGQNFGAGRLDRVREGVSFAYRFALIYGVSVAVLMFTAGGLLADLFGLEPAAKAAALLQMHIVPVSYMALGCAMAVNGALNAMGKPMAAMLVSLSRTVMVYAPLAWLLSQHFGLGLKGIFFAAASANFVAGAIGTAWFRLVFNESLASHQAKTATQEA